MSPTAFSTPAGTSAELTQTDTLVMKNIGFQPMS